MRKGTHFCFLTGHLGQGGAERQLYYIIRALRELGAKVTLIGLTTGEYFEQTIRDLGVEYFYVSSSSSLGKMRAIINIVRKLKPDIVQAQHFYMNLYAYASAKLSGAISVGGARSDIQYSIDHTGKILGNLCLKRPDYLMPNSLEAVKKAIEFGRKESSLFYIPNAVDMEIYPPVSYEEKPFLTLLTIGRFISSKRPENFLKLLSELKSSGIKIKGIMVGDGPMDKEIEMKAKSMGLEGEIEFTGRVTRPIDYYHKADLFLLTSDNEGTPNVVLEAMACGLPVVSSAVGNLPNLFKDKEDLYMLDPGDYQGFYKALDELCRDKGLRIQIGKQGRKAIIQNHSLANLPASMERIYSQILKSKNE